MSNLVGVITFLLCLDVNIVYAGGNDSTGISLYRKNEIGVQYNPIFYNNPNAFHKGFYHNIYSLKYGNHFKEWMYLGVEMNFIFMKNSFNFPAQSYKIIPELYSKFNLLKNKNKNCTFFIETNVGYLYSKGKYKVLAMDGSSYNTTLYLHSLIYFITPGVRFFLFPDAFNRRLSLDLLCKLAPKKDFLVNYNYYVPSFKVNYHFDKVKFKFKFNTTWLKYILD